MTNINARHNPRQPWGLLLTQQNVRIAASAFRRIFRFAQIAA